MVIFKCFIAPSHGRTRLGAACCKMLNINKILQNIFCTQLCQRLWNKCFLHYREMETGCTGFGGLSISWYFELDRNTLLRPAQSHLPGLDVWSVRTSIELTPNWQLNYCCTSIVNLLIWGIRQLGGREGGKGVIQNPCQRLEEQVHSPYNCTWIYHKIYHKILFLYENPRLPLCHDHW